MAIRGSLKEASLPDVLQLLAMGQKTGCLSVAHRSSFGSIYFDRGRICYAAIVNRRDRLGDILVANGLVEREVLDEVIRGQGDRPERRLGDLLVERGMVDREVLDRHIRMQIEEAVYHLFTWMDGTFNFEPELRPEEEDLLVSINPESLLLEGARRVDEWSLIEKKISSFDLIFAVDRQHIDERQPRLTAEQELLLPLLDGRRDVDALVHDSGMVEFEVGKALYGLVTAGFAHRVGKSRPVDAPRVSDVRLDEHRNLGIAFYKTGMYDEAMREFRRVLELRPEDVAARFFVGLGLMRQGRWDEAVQMHQGAAQHPSALPPVFHNLAYALERLGRYDEAWAALDEAIRRGGGEDARIQTSRGVLALRRGDVAGADSLLRDARERWGKRTPPAAWFHYAALAAALGGELARAVEVLEEGVHAHPHAAPLHNNLAAARERSGDAVGALAAAEQGLLADASLAQLYKNVGDVHYRAGRYDEAFESFQRAVRAAPELGADVWLKLGNLRFRRDDAQGAEECWTRALELDPTNAIVRNNLEAVRRTSAA